MNLSKADDKWLIVGFRLIIIYPSYHMVTSGFSVLIQYKTFCLTFLGSPAICIPVVCLKLKTGHICVHTLSVW